MWLWISNSLEKHASQSKEESSYLLPRYKWMHRWDSMSLSSFFSWNQHITKYVYEAIPDGLAQTREPHHTWSSYQVYTISLIHGPGKCCGTIIGMRCLNETVNSSSVTALKLKCLKSWIYPHSHEFLAYESRQNIRWDNGIPQRFFSRFCWIEDVGIRLKNSGYFCLSV